MLCQLWHHVGDDIYVAFGMSPSICFAAKSGTAVIVICRKEFTLNPASEILLPNGQIGWVFDSELKEFNAS